VVVAERDSEIVGVGMASLSGEIMLNYVHPEARFGGVSKSILATLEETLRFLGVQRCRLESTINAQSFYESCGFRPEAGNALILFKPL
jgi:N-acetylglutamate synthase-like GNAT family acetyltransferase